MIVMAFITMVVTIFYSYRQYPFRISLSRQVLTDGRSMIQLGVAFVVAAIIGSLAELLIRLFLNYHNQMGEVGLYNAAYTLTISYAALVLASLETDYFPRLSASAHDLQTAQMIVNRQMEVLFLLLAPMLTALMVFLPWLVPLLYTEQFLSIVPMAQIMVIAMYFKALSVPVCFMPLAFQESRSYLLLEISYWLYFLMFFFICYELWGLRGVGIAWVIAYVVEWLVAWAWVHHHYHYQLSLPMIRHIVIQLIIAMTTWLVTMYLSDSSYWISGCLLTMMSGGFSCWILSCKR
jgi:O-antigen/teichoic acid export membrane protein